MPIVALVLGVLASVGIVFVTRWSGRKQVDAAAMLLVAVLTSSLGMGAIVLATHAPDALGPFLGKPQLAAVLFTGLTGAAGTVMYFAALGIGPSGPVATIMALHLLIPILCAVAFWRERLTAAQVVGVTLAVLAICLINAGRDEPATEPEDPRSSPGAPAGTGGWAWKGLAVGGMFLMGLTSASAKYKQVHFPDMPDTLYLTLYWLTCVPLLAAYLLARRRPITPAAWGPGLIVGLLLMACNFGMYLGLRSFSTTTVFLATNGGPPILVVVLSMLVLREHYPRRVQVAIAAGLAGLCLIIWGAAS